MKISRFIEKLQEIQHERGDIEVMMEIPYRDPYAPSKPEETMQVKAYLRQAQREYGQVPVALVNPE